MIGFIKGKVQNIENLQNASLIVYVNSNENSGIGYFITTPYSLESFKEGETLELWIQQIFREDSNSLYGFKTTAEKTLFNQLLSVTGIGPKVALSILGTFGIDGVLNAIYEENVNELSKTSGLGKKGASRIILELKGKLVVAENKPKQKNSELLIEALVNLGFKKGEVLKTVEEVSNEFGEINEKNIPVALKAALQSLNR